MTHDLNQSVSAAVRAAARPVSVEELQERGVAKVNSVRMSHICDVLEKAIHRALVARSVSGVEDDEVGLPGETRSEFVKLLQDPEPTGKDTITERANQELTRLNRELDRQRTDLDRQAQAMAGGATADSDDADQLERQLRTKFRRFANGSLPIDQLEEAVVSASLAAQRHEQRRAQQIEMDAIQSDTRVLERRIRKLQRLLSDTESRLPQAETGLAAGRRDLEGLDPEDRKFQQKAGLLKGVFQQNAGRVRSRRA